MYKYLADRHKILIRTIRHHVICLFTELFRNDIDKDKPVIIFIRRGARSRIYNHALSLKSHEVQSILIAQTFDYPYHKKVFNKICIWYRISDICRTVIKLCNKYNVIAVVGSLQPAVQTIELLKLKNKFPLLIDHHDSAWSQVYFQNLNVNNYENSWINAIEVEQEKKCFTSVDGVIARSNELKELFTRNSITTPIEVFEDCCSDQYFQPIDFNDGPRGKEWSLAYAGMVFPSSLAPEYSFPQFMSMSKYFNNEKIHFHIYPGQNHEYCYPDYEAESKINEYFHMKRSLSFMAIRKALTQYDFGLVAFNPPENYKMFSQEHFKHIIHAKFHTYLEAGLPIIVSPVFEREAEILLEAQAGIIFDGATPEGLRERIEQEDIKQMRKNVSLLRESFNVKNQGARLSSFINKVQKEKLKI